MFSSYNSILKWIKMPFQYYPFDTRLGTGTPTFKTVVNATCYATGQIESIVSKAGKEETSNAQLYVRGDLSITDNDEVVFESKRRPIKAISTFYENGKPIIKVVYL